MIFSLESIYAVYVVKFGKNMTLLYIYNILCFVISAKTILRERRSCYCPAATCTNGYLGISKLGLYSRPDRQVKGILHAREHLTGNECGYITGGGA